MASFLSKRILAAARRGVVHRITAKTCLRYTTAEGEGAALCAALNSSLANRRGFSSMLLHQPSQRFGQGAIGCSLSTAAVASSEATTSASATTADGSKTSKATKKDDSHLFWDNLGTFFLAAIGVIIGSLVRSYYGTKNKNALRDDVETLSALDPIEVDDLRVANDEFDRHVFSEIVQDILNPTNQQQLQVDEKGNFVMTYNDFVFSVRKTMKRLKGESFTIQLGHLLDRAVVQALTIERAGSTQDGKVASTEDPQPLLFWFTCLSLALSTPVRERIHILYEILQRTAPLSQNSSTTTENENEASSYNSSDENNNSTNNSTESSNIVTLQQVQELVQYLQETCQLVPDKQVVVDPDRYIPTQQYKRGIASEEVIHWLLDDKEQKKEAKDNTTTTTTTAAITAKTMSAAASAALSSGSAAADIPISVEEFTAILRSRAVCAWGECYRKRRYA